AQVNVTPPDVVKKMFQQAAQGKNYMNAADLAAFLENVQGEKNITEAHAVWLITQTVLSVIPGIHFSISVQSVRLDLQGFLSYLLNPRLNPPLMPSDIPTQDMTKPLSHYFIYSSHNSYLTGNQLTSKSSTIPIGEALRGGCRVIELDCWERRGRIKVLHGNTLTRSVEFKDCVATIKENAFLASNYPIIITIENHLPPGLQDKAAMILKEIIGDHLFYPSKDERPPIQFQSPEALKGLIIVSDKPPSDSIEDQLVEDPQGVNAFVEEDIDEDLRLNGRDIRRASKIKKHFKRAQRKTIQKVVQHAAIVIGDAPSHHVPKTIAFEELIYIYCAKPEEMKEKHKKGGPLINNLGRMYPFGLRFNSSNADPMVAWSHGIQVAAINMQGNDRPVWVARALFSANGNCGYVKKPDLFLPGSNFDYEQISSLPPKVLLKVTVLLGTNWHKNFDFCKPPDFYVKVTCIPMMEMRFGIRSVALHSKKGLLQSSKLLCHF
ncbi:hypothetical protein BDL97_20G006900, partial [Sphagnum fallax]